MGDVGTTVVAGFTKTALKEVVKAKTKQDVRTAVPEASDRVVNATATLVGNVVDVAYDGVVKGGLQSGTAIQLATKGVAAAVSGLSENEKLACFSALLTLGGEAAELTRHVGTAAAIEVGTGGWGTAIVAMQAGLMIRSAANTASAIVKVNQQCGPLVARGYADLEADWAALAAQLERSVTQTVTSQSML